MGNFLKAPITIKHSEKGRGNGLDYGSSMMQGWRATMEDAHCMVDSLPNFNLASFFAVFDGHGGTLAAEYAAKHIIDVIISQSEFRDQMDLESIGPMLRQAFLCVDANMRKLPQFMNNEDHSGCTAIGAFITPTHIVVANTGDSRSVLAKGNKTVPMSFDHKPSNPGETKRVEKAGGSVRNKRVNGDLAVSRALGDFIYKCNTDLPAHEQQISPEPDIIAEERNGTEEFLVIACDGIWDVMSNDDVCAYIRQLLLDGETDMSLISEELIDHCLTLGSRDNMSAIVIAMCGIKYGSGAGVAGLRAAREAELKLAEAQKAQSNAAQ